MHQNTDHTTTEERMTALIGPSYPSGTRLQNQRRDKMKALIKRAALGDPIIDHHPRPLMPLLVLGSSLAIICASLIAWVIKHA